MKALTILILLGIFSLLLAAGGAEGPVDSNAGQNPPTPAEAPVESPAESSLDQPTASPIPATVGLGFTEVQGIRAAIAREESRLRELQSELDAAQEEAGALRILEEMGKVKRDTERTILRIQAHHARQSGHEELAARIEAVLGRMDAPPPPPMPQPRRVPASGAGQ